MLRDAGIGLDDHTELQVLSLVHLDREALVGEPWGQLGGHPDVGLVCREEVQTSLEKLVFALLLALCINITFFHLLTIYR